LYEGYWRVIGDSCLDVFDGFESFGFGACREVDVCGVMLGELEDGFFSQSDVACEERC
jgi:hypothetical protein